MFRIRNWCDTFHQCLCMNFPLIVLSLLFGVIIDFYLFSVTVGWIISYNHSFWCPDYSIFDQWKSFQTGYYNFLINFAFTEKLKSNTRNPQISFSQFCWSFTFCKICLANVFVYVHIHTWFYLNHFMCVKPPRKRFPFHLFIHVFTYRAWTFILFIMIHFPLWLRSIIIILILMVNFGQ